MKIRVVWVGKTRNRDLATVSQGYASRIRRFVGLDLLTLKESRIADDARRIDDESQKILSKLSQSDYVVGLDPEGRSYDSPSFARFLAKHMREDPRDLTFVVGGPAGLSGELKDRADILWSFTPLTLSHDLARVLLLEQIYRALGILNNLPYAR